ncbi:hypothetical protein M3182_19695 [Mesobacillus maritimus]|uniref:hypothetical protein n=1 Tax=Mesobacillus maritimus TaxID=1643336 RepID=UPI0020423717|nr:hypothetical protein [Mesobacillus maritimus]MCM3587953.1 hypothetical protein [Mesobacillus maritimus]
MDFIYLIVGSAIILTCFYFVVSPFFSRNEGRSSETDSWESTLTLDSVYSAVNELEMDYLMKKIKEKDFLQLKEQYQMIATELVKQEGKPKRETNNNVSQAEEAELELLRELQKLRKKKGRSS